MARLVRKEAQAPVILDKEELGKKVAICACGLSDASPMCDGSHKATQDESDDGLYYYEDNDATKRNLVKDLNKEPSE